MTCGNIELREHRANSPNKPLYVPSSMFPQFKLHDDQRSTNGQSDQWSSNGQCDSVQAMVRMIIGQAMVGVTSGQAMVRMTCGQAMVSVTVFKQWSE